MKQAEKNRRSRELILLHAFAEFAQHGYAGSSLNQICARGNISKGFCIIIMRIRIRCISPVWNGCFMK